MQPAGAMRTVVASAAAGTTAYAVASADGWPNRQTLATPMLDFHTYVWAPARGMFSGYDIYDPAGSYVRAFKVAAPASAHTPAMLTVFAPFSALPLHAAWLAFVAVNALCIWAALLLLSRPTAPRHYLLVLVFGVALTLGGFGQLLFALGQMTGVVLLGLTLLWRFPRGRLGAAGLVLLSVSPQTVVPAAIMLARGRRRALVVGAAAVAALSVVPVAIALHASSSVPALVRSLRQSVTAATVSPNRIDLVGRLFGHGSVVPIVLLLALAATLAVHRWDVRSTDPSALLTVVTLTVAFWYHQPYDVVLIGAVLCAVVCRSDAAEHHLLAAVVLAGCLLTDDRLSRSLADATGVGRAPVWRGIAQVMSLAALFTVLTTYARQRLGTAAGPPDATRADLRVVVEKPPRHAVAGDN